MVSQWYQFYQLAKLSRVNNCSLFKMPELIVCLLVVGYSLWMLFLLCLYRAMYIGSFVCDCQIMHLTK